MCVCVVYSGRFFRFHRDRVAGVEVHVALGSGSEVTFSEYKVPSPNTQSDSSIVLFSHIYLFVSRSASFIALSRFFAFLFFFSL